MRFCVLFSVESYLQDIHVQSLNNSVGVNAIPTGAHIRDDEQVRLCDYPFLEEKQQKKTNNLFVVVTVKMYFFCPPPFRRKVEGHCFWFSVAHGSEFLVGTLSP